MHNRNNHQIESDDDQPLFSSNDSSEMVAHNRNTNQSGNGQNSNSLARIFKLVTSIPTKLNRGIYNTVKGHRLLFWCVSLLMVVYGIEMWRKDGVVSPAGEKIIEILKLLIFSVSGYLFGTHENEKKDN